MPHPATDDKRGAPQVAIPDKLFYKIGEVSRLTGIEAYVLRYWETEFQFLRPRKSRSGQRIYVKKDLELVLMIKGLLYGERLTIEGVRRRLGDEGRGKPHAAEVTSAAVSGNPMERVKQRLREILSRIS